MRSFSGGTIFNGGHQVGDNSTGNGMRVESGTFTLTGVVVRNNRGVGVIANGASPNDVQGFVIAGCKFYGNDKGGVQLNSEAFALTGNVFNGNGPNQVVGASTGAVIANNVGCCGPKT